MNDTPTIDDSLPLPPAPGKREGVVTEGETFGHYQVLRREDGRLWELGRGAMGVTYKAFDTNLRCHVALKVISADYLHSAMAGQRFVREARVAARLRHPNIANVYHLGVDPQGFFYSMEFIDGETLEDLVARAGPLPVETVLHVGLQVARALAAASRQGLIHRDIKPANVMVLRESEGGDEPLAVKVIDFGLARSYAAEDTAPQLTATGFVGTPLFSSPEQLEEQDLDVRSDIYSLGVTLWILLVGRPPFEGKMTQVITQHLHAPPPWWQLPPCPEPVRMLLEKMLQKNRLQRYQNAGELRTAMENCLRAVSNREDLLLPLTEGTDPGKTAHPATPAALPVATPPKAAVADTVTGHLGAAARSFARAAGRRRNLAGVATALVVLLVLLVIGVVFRRDDDKPPAAPPKTVAPVTVNVPAAVSPTAVAVAEPTPTPEPVASTPEPTPAPPAVVALPPSFVVEAEPLEPRSGLDGLDASPAVESPTPTPSPVAAVANDAHEDAVVDASPAAQATKNMPSRSSTRTHHNAHRTPTPAPNFFQKLFGIKPKPTPKKSR